jgi:serine/threonine protein kinase
MKKDIAFNFPTGRILARKYQIEGLLGSGWEGEVYRLRELSTNVERAAKFFYPKRNLHNRKLKFYAKKLHRLRTCKILIQYHTQEMIWNRGEPIFFLVSEFVQGELLETFLKRQPGGRLHYFQAVHLLHSLAEGMEEIHEAGEYHGDLHSENIIIQSHGLGFDLKLLDFYSWGRATAENRRDDVVAMIHLFYEAMGGRKHYPRLPDEIKRICSGLKRSLILKNFSSAGQLRIYLEKMKWQ